MIDMFQAFFRDKVGESDFFNIAKPVDYLLKNSSFRFIVDNNIYYEYMCIK